MKYLVLLRRMENDNHRSSSDLGLSQQLGFQDFDLQENHIWCDQCKSLKQVIYLSKTIPSEWKTAVWFLYTLFLSVIRAYKCSCFVTCWLPLSMLKLLIRFAVHIMIFLLWMFIHFVYQCSYVGHPIPQNLGDRIQSL